MRDVRDAHWVDQAERAILGILEEQSAAPWIEIEARAADRAWTRLARPINVHHLTTARQNLSLGPDPLIVETPGITRGGRDVSVLHLPVTPGRKRLVERTIARKRLLYARHQGWATGSVRYPNGLIGPAGEAVLRASIREAALLGRYAFVHPVGKDVSFLFGTKVPGGSLDDAGTLLSIMPGGLPGPNITFLTEIKNVREHQYPRSRLLYQLLTKAARLQVAHPDLWFLPIFASRKRSQTLRNMGKDLGFYSLDFNRQYILPVADLSQRAVDEVRIGLGMEDLTVSQSADPALVSVFAETVPFFALATAERWRARALVLLPLLEAMLKAPSAGSLARLRTAAGTFADASGGW
ncbi:MAG: hypothetical protein M3395_09980 [Chloroflexota bacterium]|nr:hypothetical protein [Chloroflexota bacterium]